VGPRVDLSETKDSVVATAEIPGVEQKDVNVSLHEQVLTIKVEKHREKEEKDEKYHRSNALGGPSCGPSECPLPHRARRW